eukprot:GHVS01026175.1.p1 GENE.GHVS01026175.1~~GHVS01026175.1.p1  ORF type:complete len:259 (+),score=48.00 GHVS01026175.1:1395-2171(+)
MNAPYASSRYLQEPSSSTDTTTTTTGVSLLDSSSSVPSSPRFCCCLRPATSFLFCLPLSAGIFCLGLFCLIPLEVLLLPPSHQLSRLASGAGWTLYVVKCLLGLSYLWSAVVGVRCCGVVLCVHQLTMTAAYGCGVVQLILWQRNLTASLFACFGLMCLYFAYLGWSYKWLPQLLPGQGGAVRAERWLWETGGRLSWADHSSRAATTTATATTTVEVPLRPLEHSGRVGGGGTTASCEDILTTQQLERQSIMKVVADV